MAITRALHQGEESLLELTKQICCFLQVCHYNEWLTRKTFTLKHWPVEVAKLLL